MPPWFVDDFWVGFFPFLLLLLLPLFFLHFSRRAQISVRHQLALYEVLGLTMGSWQTGKGPLLDLAGEEAAFAARLSALVQCFRWCSRWFSFPWRSRGALCFGWPMPTPMLPQSFLRFVVVSGLAVRKSAHVTLRKSHKVTFCRGNENGRSGKDDASKKRVPPVVVAEASIVTAAAVTAVARGVLAVNSSVRGIR